jgi:hypothetical protein
VLTCADEGLVLPSVPSDRYRFVAALSEGAALGDALESSGLEVDALPAVLAWLFTDGLVVALRVPDDGAAARGLQ